MVAHATHVILFSLPGDGADDVAAGDVVVSSGDEAGEWEVRASALDPDGEEICGVAKVSDEVVFLVDGVDLPAWVGSFGPAGFEGDADSVADGLEGSASFVKGAQGVVVSFVVEEQDEEVVWSEESYVEEFHLVEADDHGVSLQVAVRVVEEDVEVPPFSSAAFVESFVCELEDVSAAVDDAVGPGWCWLVIILGDG